MGIVRILAIVLIIAGVLGLIYGSFTYTKDTHEANLGPVELSVDEKETVGVPVWAGAGAIAFGSLLLLLGRSRN
jgi:TRAP-type C4-dicarboxylate transport system permease small subunit